MKKLTSVDCVACGNINEKCEQECMMEAATKEIEYFEDEELDRFSGRESNQYSSEETEEFRYILNTMRADEVPAWNRSLCLRGIAVPDGLKDELSLFLTI